MALDPVPWAIDGAETPAALARAATYAATRGVTGVTRSGDLKVTPLPTPGDAVRIMPGSAVVVNRYPGGAGQSYVVRNPTATTVDIPATGSSGGANRYLILRVDDPEFPGIAAPADPLNGPYVRPVLVSSISNLAYPFIVLALIKQPANTATITAGMIEDRRSMVYQQSERALRVNPVAAAHNLVSTTWVNFPNVKETIAVPSWATYAVVSAQVGGLQQVTGPVAAEFSLHFNDVQGQLTAMDQPGTPTSYTRPPGLLMKWESPVSAVAGGTAELKIMAKKLSGSGYLRADNYTQIVYDVQFTEVPV